MLLLFLVKQLFYSSPITAAFHWCTKWLQNIWCITGLLESSNSIIARSLGLKQFTTVIHHLGNVLLQKNSFLLPVFWWTDSILLCRRGELLDFLVCRNSPIKLRRSFRWIFYLPSKSKEQILPFSYSVFPSVFHTSVSLPGASNTPPPNG